MSIQPTYEGNFAFAEKTPFALDGGGALQPVTLRYALYGRLNERRDNAILICHALSGSARVGDWWPAMVGPSGWFAPEAWCVIGVNVLGSCYGSTGPRSVHPQTGVPYGIQFPPVTIRDMVRAQAELLAHLGVTRLHGVMGGSIGAMQSLAWAIDFPERVERCVAIGAAPLGAMGLALNHLQRQAICNDPAWRAGQYAEAEPPGKGLALARAIAMCTYKSPALFAERFGRRPNRNGEQPLRSLEDRFDVAGYLDYQGEIFTGRFDANTYLVLSKAMDTFDLGLGYASTLEALRRIQATVHLIGISSDWLFPSQDVRSLAAQMKHAGVKARYSEVISDHGHDAFLVEMDQLAQLMGNDFTSCVAEERR